MYVKTEKRNHILLYTPTSRDEYHDCKFCKMRGALNQSQGHQHFIFYKMTNSFIHNMSEKF